MTIDREPPWLDTAREYIGLSEIPGTGTNSTIRAWLERLKAWWRDDETPWCGAFVAYCMDVNAFAIPKYWMRARDWANWGRELMTPIPGCIVVFSRQGGGHVGFVVGKDADDRLLVLGGNQGNRVSIATFTRDRVLAYRWPTEQPLLGNAWLPTLSSAGKPSTNEA